jgi:hypothetical protein
MRRYESRLRALEAQFDPPWPRAPGLAALVDAARTLPRPEPWDDALWKDGPHTGLGRLLAEARQWGARRTAPEGQWLIQAQRTRGCADITWNA